MNRIAVLDKQTADAIAAGEVIERPASVVKELIENALDAKANKIEIEIRGGGVKLIRVSDNGHGINPDDLPLAFLRFSTSKLRSIEDLNSIKSMGFRGEALASIAAVSKVRAKSRTADSEEGLVVNIEGSELINAHFEAAAKGTSIEVRELFYNTPARFKFLKSDRSENSYVTDIVGKLALVNPACSFRLIIDKKEVLHSPGNNDLTSVVYLLWGKKLAQGMHAFRAEVDNIKIHGLLARADLPRHNRSRQLFFVNGRYIHSDLLRQAVQEGAKDFFMKGKFPQLILFMELPASEVDVNVHPQKSEVRFADERKIFSLLYHCLREKFSEISIVPERNLFDKKTAKQPNIPSIIDHNIQNASEIRAELPLHQERIFTRTVSSVNSHKISVAEAPKTAEPKKDYGEKTIEQAPTIEHSELASSLSDARYVGQIFTCFLLFESGNILYVVDQHAAHERVLYELFSQQRRARGEGPRRQEDLLVPQLIDLDPREYASFIDKQEIFTNEGFELDSLKAGSVVIRAVPYGLNKRIEIEDLFRSILDKIMDNSSNTDALLDLLDQEMACKAALKAGDLVTQSEVVALIQDLVNCDNPYHCPHGRPTINQFERYDLEKIFKRIV